MKTKIILLLIIATIISSGCSKYIKSTTKTNEKTAVVQTINTDSTSNQSSVKQKNQDISFKIIQVSVDTSASGIDEQLKVIEQITGIKIPSGEVKKRSNNKNTILNVITIDSRTTEIDSTKSNTQLVKQENINTKTETTKAEDVKEKRSSDLKRILLYLLIISIIVFLIILKLKGGGIFNSIKNLFKPKK